MSSTFKLILIITLLGIISTQTTDNMVDITKFEAITFNNIPPAYWGRYTMEFYIYITSSNLINGVNIIWKNHIAISAYYDFPDLALSCFPQDYLVTPFGKYGINLKTLVDNTFNKDTATISGISGTWVWARCAVSWDNRQYYINSNTPRTLYGEMVYSSTFSDFPFRYNWQPGELSSLVIDSAKINNTEMHLRNIWLFNDYLPQTFIFDRFYMNNAISKFSSLVFVTDFNNYVSGSSTLPYVTSTNTYTVTLTPALTGVNYVVANTRLLMCDPTGASPKQYASATNTCVANTCLAAVHSNLCYYSNALSCANNYFFNAGTSSCTAPCYGSCDTTCLNDTFRSPGSKVDNAICNFVCNNHDSCSLPASQMLDLKTNLKCKDGYVRYAYNCVSSSIADSGNYFLK